MFAMTHKVKNKALLCLLSFTNAIRELGPQQTLMVKALFHPLTEKDFTVKPRTHARLHIKGLFGSPGPVQLEPCVKLLHCAWVCEWKQSIHTHTFSLIPFCSSHGFSQCQHCPRVPVHVLYYSHG